MKLKNIYNVIDTKTRYLKKNLKIQKKKIIEIILSPISKIYVFFYRIN